MPEFRYGPVEFYLVGLESTQPDPSTLDALGAMLETGAVRLLDFVLLSKSPTGELTLVETDDIEGVAELELAAPGLAGDADAAEFAEHIPDGSAALLVAFELVFQRELASRLAASGGVVLHTERIPAPVVNALIDLETENEGD
ncbi:DUF6325 family protein [Microbacterium sp.]|uniref:DUF6325 family protein n=1 Tax=Microbacterium sp. TaxID=51671 RepID=UPI003A91B114